MKKELAHLEDYLFEASGISMSNVYAEEGTEDYCGYNFHLGSLNVKYRKAKITPKKTGQFVALWKRNAERKTAPYHMDDNFDFYIVEGEYEHNRGCFIFPKTILAEKQILSAHEKEGKRGFRVYTTWDIPNNKQAINTKSWQVLYFVDFIEDRKTSVDKILKAGYALSKAGYAP